MKKAEPLCVDKESKAGKTGKADKTNQNFYLFSIIFYLGKVTGNKRKEKNERIREKSTKRKSHT